MRQRTRDRAARTVPSNRTIAQIIYVLNCIMTEDKYTKGERIFEIAITSVEQLRKKKKE